jgi:hypothetical protein
MFAWLAAYPIGVAIPGVDAPANAVEAYAAQHGGELLIFGVLVALGATLLVGFFAGLSEQLRAASNSVQLLSSIGLAAGVMTQTLVMAGVAFAQAESLTTESGSAAVAPHNNGIFYVFFAISAWPTILTSVAYGLALLRTGLCSRASAWFAFAAAAIHLGAGLSLARTGLWSLSGPISQTAPAVFMLWVIGVSVELLVRQQRLAQTAARSHDQAPQSWT